MNSTPNRRPGRPRTGRTPRRAYTATADQYALIKAAAEIEGVRTARFVRMAAVQVALRRLEEAAEASAE